MTNAAQQENAPIQMMGEHLAVTLTAEEISQVSGARWVSTWCATRCCGCADSEFVN